MSTSRRGDSAKKGQKYQNAWAFKPGLHRTGRQRAQDVASLPPAGLCARCKEKIEWRRKYDKYKPLSAPRKCTVCGGRKVKQAYYHLCRECSQERGVCAKCGKTVETVESYPPTAEDRGKEEAESRMTLQALRERERRALLRRAGKETAGEKEAGEASEEEEEEEEEGPEDFELAGGERAQEEARNSSDSCTFSRDALLAIH